MHMSILDAQEEIEVSTKQKLFFVKGQEESSIWVSWMVKKKWRYYLGRSFFHYLLNIRSLKIAKIVSINILE